MIPGRPEMGPRSISRSRSASAGGQGLTEFALILPVFMLLLLIAVDFGRLFYTYIQLNNTAREGAAYVALNPTTDDATLTTIALRESNVQAQRGETAIAATSSCVDATGTGLACASALGGDGAGNRVTVNVSEPFNFFTPLISSFWQSGLTVKASATATVTAWAAGGGVPPPACNSRPSTPSFTWQSPDKVNRPNFISVDGGASPNQASPCQNVGYNWDFGGASTDPNSDYLREGVTQDYEYAAPGTYTITLVVSNAAGDSPPATRVITLGTTPCNAPVASFTVSPALVIDKHGSNWEAENPGGQGGTAFTFDGSASAFMSDSACHPVWSWALGDNTSPAPSTNTVSGHTYAHAYANTTVRVTLTVKNDAGLNTKSFDIPLQ